MKIKSITAREILSSGSTPSIEVKVTLQNGTTGKASVPFGASAGIHEAYVLFDGAKRYSGKGMLKAVNNINKKIAPNLRNKDAFDQPAIDQLMIDIDGTKNKKKLGGNAILAVSVAVARAAANAQKLPLYAYIRKAYQLPIKKYVLPNPQMVVIEGGKHADNSTDMQEYMVAPIKGNSVKEEVQAGIEVYLALKKVLKQKNLDTNVGNEGAYAPAGLKSNESPLQLIRAAIKKAGYSKKDIGISLDPATSELFHNGKYHLKKEKKKLTSVGMINYFKKWLKKYPEIITLEDPLHEDDWAYWPEITRTTKIPIIGDDLTVTNPERLQRAIDTKAINAILIKLNQIGTLTETVQTCMLARNNNMMTIVSHRGGGETNDTAMVDLAVAVNAAFIKVGPSRGERVCKYNRLMEIADELKAKPVGKNFRIIH
ncbi:MAG: phosphopyruvate hydratase [Nanoarchaeota archaeon]|nr:phosphopyruvate hydratase [Nanoarchaeota archaeon]